MKRWGLPALLMLIVTLFVVRNLPWHLDDYDQAKQAFTSFEMVRGGQWWFQHTPDGKVATKPPLAGWISAAIYRISGWWDGAWRLPSFLSALIILALLVRSGQRLWPVWGAVVCAAAFGLNSFSPRLASLVRTDMLLTLFIFGVGWLIYEKLRTGEPWRTRDRVAVGLLVLGSMLTKGPIAYAFLLPGLVAFWWFSGRSNRAWSGWLSWTLPLLVFGAWVWVGTRDPAFYDEVVMREFLGRFTVGEKAVHRNQPVYFYVTHILGKWAPWSVLLITALCMKNIRAAIRRDPALLWLVCWVAAGLLVMSLVPSKRADRIFPVIPPLCLLLAACMACVEWQRRQRVLVAAVVVAIIGSGGYVVYNIIDASRHDDGVLARWGREVREQHPRLEVSAGKDEGMLLYLDRLQFTDVDDAEAMWQAGEIDALVIDERNLGKSALFQSIPVARATPERHRKNSRYFLLLRKMAR